MRATHLVSYDIRDDVRLRKVARLLEGYGDRVQYSVFRCCLSLTELQRLRWQLTRAVAPEDSVLFIPLCSQCNSKVSGIGKRQDWSREDPAYRVV